MRACLKHEVKRKKLHKKWNIISMELDVGVHYCHKKYNLDEGDNLWSLYYSAVSGVF